MIKILIQLIQHQVWVEVQINHHNQLFLNSFYERGKTYFLKLKDRNQRSRVIVIIKRFKGTQVDLQLVSHHIEIQLWHNFHLLVGKTQIPTINLLSLDMNRGRWHQDLSRLLQSLKHLKGSTKQVKVLV